MIDRIEEHRDRVVGLEYETWWDRRGDERLEFKLDVLARDGYCVVHDSEDECEGELQAHHVVTQQHLRKRGLDHLLWDPRLGVTVCEKAHRRHTLAIERIPLAALPSGVTSFVTELGLDWMLERYYGAAA